MTDDTGPGASRPSGAAPAGSAGSPAGGDAFAGLSAPTITAPKGGGAVRGIGEKFATNPVTGTGTLTVPLPVSPGRSGFGPNLSLTYDAGNQHGAFGLGWQLNLPQITRRTDKGLPAYDDARDGDVFLLSDAEDLVPELDAAGVPVRRTRDTDEGSFQVTRYRPRIDGLYARIERWTAADGQIHWRSISRDDVTTIYGRDPNSRIADPADPRLRIFSWLICASYDDRGNAIEYEYAEEDDAGADLAAAHERGRPAGARTANRYLKFVRYGNRSSRLAPAGPGGWHFELVFDFGEHDEQPTSVDTGTWLCRHDPFSTYRPGFELRSYRLCQRVLMFHHFPGRPGVGDDCLVRSLRLDYRDRPGEPGDRRLGEPAGALLASVTFTGHRRSANGYLSRSLPPLEFSYTTASTDREVRDLEPIGVDDTAAEWADIDGVSLAGLLSRQSGAWYFRPNQGQGRLGPVQRLPRRPSAGTGTARGRLLDLTGDGRLDVVDLDGPAPGFFERTDDGEWAPLRRFATLPVRDWSDPNLLFADLDGDGRHDVLVAEGDSLVWHRSLGEEGYGEGVRVALPPDDDAGPRLLFADGTQSVYSADMSGDGQPDVVRIRNGEVCYWPSLGRARFGPKVVMDNAPLFDRPDRFDQRRLHLVDLDNKGPADVLYLSAEGVDRYTNLMGNSWSGAARLPAVPPIDDVASVSVVDLLGTGTGCLLWSSPLPGAGRRRIRFVELIGEKPDLLQRVVNNLGAETTVHYTTSTRCYLRDEAAGRPWITRLPFPVHVVDQAETVDRVSRTRFVVRYDYHDPYFDPDDREFRGFALVEQEDSAELAALSRSGELPANADPAHRLPPTRTRTWFHTGAFLGRDRLSRLFAEGYYPPPEHAAPEALSWLLDDTPLPAGLAEGEEREACRALKGRMLRQEVYAVDGTDREPHPYTVVESNYSIRTLQAPAAGRAGVFAVDPRETVTATCERDPADARVGHEVVLDVDKYGTVLHAVSLAYGRSRADPTLPARTRAAQATSLAVETRVVVTDEVDEDDAFRVPVAYDTSRYQVTGPAIDGSRPRLDQAYLESSLRGALPGGLQRRLIGRERVRFLADDLTGPLDWGERQARGLVHEAYRLALPDDRRQAVYAGRVTGTMLTAAGYVAAGGAWWMPSGKVRYGETLDAQPADAEPYARKHFFLPRWFVDPFGALDPDDEYATAIEYDEHDLLPEQSVDPAGNTVTAGERDAAGARIPQVDYRVLAPTLITDPNGNRTAVAFDALGMVTATAVLGRAGADTGDRLDDIDPDPPATGLAAFWTDPYGGATALLGRASTRIVYDLDAYRRTAAGADPQPAGVASIARERHVNDPPAPNPPQITFSYADGGGRDLQRKLPAEPDPGLPGPAPRPPRWVGSGWTVLDNKGNPVRSYEPFFTAKHTFEFAVTTGVSPVVCYDPPGRPVATLHPDHTYDKVLIGPWQHWTWDANDTAGLPDVAGRPTGNPADDPHIGAYAALLPTTDYLPTWMRRRIDGDQANPETAAAARTVEHAGTPLSTSADPLGRPVLTVAHNRTPGEDGAAAVTRMQHTHTVLDILGHQVQVSDGVDRTLAAHEHDLLGNVLREYALDTGARWRLTDISGAPVAEWEAVDEAGGERVRTASRDRLRRPVATTVRAGGQDRVVQLVEYGEQAPDPQEGNLRARIWRVFDGAGRAEAAYDVQGNVTATTRHLLAGDAYRGAVDWAAGPALDDDRPFTGTARFDALDRPYQQNHPDGTVVRYAYSRGGLLGGVTATLAASGRELTVVAGVEYDAKGQRTAISYGNGSTTTCTYDPDTFRLRSMTTSGGAQELGYVYDPVGNVTHISDAAQSTVFRLNTAVTAGTDYTYDALYRLVVAHGREHLGLDADGKTAAPVPGSATDVPRVQPTDRNALGRYRERYVHDTAGNLTELRHRGTDPAHPGWVRTFSYAAASRIPGAPAGVHGNRLTATGDTEVRAYGHDVRGNMDVLPPFTLIRWDHDDRLQATSTQRVGPGLVPEITYYCYDQSGERVRWVRAGQAASVDSAVPVDERVYLGDFEVYRSYGGAGAVVLERTTVHVMDGDRRVAMIETRVDAGAATDPDRLIIRFQYTDHLGSAVLELDDQGGFVSYEQYYAYGCTALVHWRANAPPKRYRFTGKERDTTGLYYHGARYYAPWLCRWTATDPEPALNEYLYCDGNPIMLTDPDGRSPGNDQWVVSPAFPDDIEQLHQVLGADYENLPQALNLQTGQSSPLLEAETMIVRKPLNEGGAFFLMGKYQALTVYEYFLIEKSDVYVDNADGTFSVHSRPQITSLGRMAPELRDTPISEQLQLSVELGLMFFPWSEALKGASGVAAAAKGGGEAAQVAAAGVHESLLRQAQVVALQGAEEQATFLSKLIPGLEREQALKILETAFKNDSSAVFGGSRIRGNFHLGSDLDVGFSKLTANQAAKATARLSKAGPLALEQQARIVTGNASRNIPHIISPEEFFQRIGIRAMQDAKAGRVFLPTGSVTAVPGGKIFFIPPGIR